MDNKKIVFVGGGLLLIVLIFFGIMSLEKEEVSNIQISDGGIIDKIKDSFKTYPSCPTNLDGILTAPFMDLKYISAITPLGNLNPPGHTSPVDHNYFSTSYKEKIPLYAPADSWITQIIEISYKDTSGNYIPRGYVIQYTICDGLILDFANYSGLSEPLKTELAKINSDDCKRGIEKPGHGYTEGQCYYKVRIPIKAGDEIGYTQLDENGTLPFEIWAANYNIPARNDVNWDYYADDRYAHSMCTFDLYSGELKKQFYEKFGRYDEVRVKDIEGNVMPGIDTFRPRTIEPLCGQVNQDIVGTIQGMWFGEGTERAGEIEFDGKGLSFVHDNIDPIIANLSIGGTIMKPGVIQFVPKYSGFIDREFSEVKADENIYCYNSPGGWWQPDIGKVLVKLIDDHKIQVEYQKSFCGPTEKFVSPTIYQR